MTRRALAPIFLTLLAAGGLLAADHPDFSGNFKLNTEKSDFGQMPKPDKADYVITHKDPDMKVKTSMVTQMGEMNTETNMTTDGKEFTNSAYGMDIKGTAKWDGAILVVSQKMSMQGQDMAITTKWSLSADGKTITQDTSMSTPQGDMTFKAVLDKQ